VNHVGQQVRNLRYFRGLSQEQLAMRFGISQASISKIERGMVRPRLSTLRRLADSLDAPFEYFDLD
jgi:transcriptional regulator with XRE-family HTH domain